MFWEVEQIGMVVNNLDELVAQAQPGQIWRDTAEQSEIFIYLHIVAPLDVSGISHGLLGGARWGNKEGTVFINSSNECGIGEEMFPLTLVKDAITSSKKLPHLDYDPTRGQWFENEPSAPALDNKDFQQSWNTDLNLPDVQRKEKEVQISDPTRDNQQLAFGSLSLTSEADFTIDDIEKCLKNIHYSELRESVRLYFEQKFANALVDPQALEFLHSITIDFSQQGSHGQDAEYFKDQNRIEWYLWYPYNQNWVYWFRDKDAETIRKYFIHEFLNRTLIHELVHVLQNYYHIKGHPDISPYPNEEHPEYYEYGDMYNNDPGEMQAKEVGKGFKFPRRERFKRYYNKQNNDLLKLSWEMPAFQEGSRVQILSKSIGKPSAYIDAIGKKGVIVKVFPQEDLPLFREKHTDWEIPIPEDATEIYLVIVLSEFHGYYLPQDLELEAPKESNLKLSWEVLPDIRPQEALELLQTRLEKDQIVVGDRSGQLQSYQETIEISRYDAEKYFNPSTGDFGDFSEIPEDVRFFSAERIVFGAPVYDIVAITSEKDILFLASGEGLSPVQASLKLSAPETYTDGSDLTYETKKEDYDNKALQFRQEDIFSLTPTEDKLWGEPEYRKFAPPGVYQKIDEDTGYADMAVTASLKLAWEVEQDFRIGDKVKIIGKSFFGQDDFESWKQYKSYVALTWLENPETVFFVTGRVKFHPGYIVSPNLVIAGDYFTSEDLVLVERGRESSLQLKDTNNGQTSQASQNIASQAAQEPQQALGQEIPQKPQKAELTLSSIRAAFPTRGDILKLYNKYRKGYDYSKEAWNVRSQLLLACYSVIASSHDFDKLNDTWVKDQKNKDIDKAVSDFLDVGEAQGISFTGNDEALKEFEQEVKKLQNTKGDEFSILCAIDRVLNVMHDRGEMVGLLLRTEIWDESELQGFMATLDTIRDWGTSSDKTARLIISEQEISYPSIPEIIDLHNEIMAQYGGTPGVFPEGETKLEAALGRMQSGMGDTEFYPTLVEKAAVLMHSIITTHPFVDGNKRTALMSGVKFLHLHGVSLEDSDTIADVVIQVAEGKMSYEQLRDWLKEYSSHYMEKHEDALLRLSWEVELETVDSLIHSFDRHKAGDVFEATDGNNTGYIRIYRFREDGRAIWDAFSNQEDAFVQSLGAAQRKTYGFKDLFGHGDHTKVFVTYLGNVHDNQKIAWEVNEKTISWDELKNPPYLIYNEDGFPHMFMNEITYLDYKLKLGGTVFLCFSVGDAARIAHQELGYEITSIPQSLLKRPIEGAYVKISSSEVTARIEASDVSYIV